MLRILARGLDERKLAGFVLQWPAGLDGDADSHIIGRPHPGAFARGRFSAAASVPMKKMSFQETVTLRSTEPRARVCIGMPVYNGENFVQQAIDSILNQTFTDIELIVSDNASTDRTAEICQAAARRDKRVTYSRLETNIGGILNFDRVYKLSGGQYFKWAAHDDTLAPTFIEKCVEVLDANPSAVLAYSRVEYIDEQGKLIKPYHVKLATDVEQPYVRFHAIAMASHKTTRNLEIFGLMRRSAMALIPPQGGYAASDRVYLARLALYGKFIEVPQALFFAREHPGQSIRTLPKYQQEKKSLLSRFIGHGQLPPAEWFDPKFTNKFTFPEWRLMWEYLTSARYGWLSTRERTLCVASVLRRQTVHGNWARMVRDFLLAGDKLMARIARAIDKGSVARNAVAKNLPSNEKNPTPESDPANMTSQSAPRAA